MPKMSDKIFFLFKVEMTFKTMNNNTIIKFTNKKKTNKTKYR